MPSKNLPWKWLGSSQVRLVLVRNDQKKYFSNVFFRAQYSCLVDGGVLFATVFCTGRALMLRTSMTLTRKTFKGRKSNTFYSRRQFSTLLCRSFLAVPSVLLCEWLCPFRPVGFVVVIGWHFLSSDRIKVFTWKFSVRCKCVEWCWCPVYLSWSCRSLAWLLFQSIKGQPGHAQRLISWS